MVVTKTLHSNPSGLHPQRYSVRMVGGAMRQATIVIPEDLEAEIETYLAAQGRQVDLSALVSDALRCYLADPQHANGHSAAPPARSAPDTSAIADDEAPEYDPLPIVIDGKEYW